MLCIFNNFVVKNVGKKILSNYCSFPLCIFLSTRLKPITHMLKLAWGLGNLAGKLLEQYFTTTCTFLLWILFQLLKIDLPLAVILELSVCHQCRLELLDRTAKENDYDLLVESSVFIYVKYTLQTGSCAALKYLEMFRLRK